MKPIAVRHALERFGEIGRVYLAPEGALAARTRTRTLALAQARA